MENNDNNEIIVKKKTSQAMKEAQKRYYNKKKENEEFQERRRAHSKKHYDNGVMPILCESFLQMQYYWRWSVERQSRPFTLLRQMYSQNRNRYGCRRCRSEKNITTSSSLAQSQPC